MGRAPYGLAYDRVAQVTPLYVGIAEVISPARAIPKESTHECTCNMTETRTPRTQIGRTRLVYLEG